MQTDNQSGASRPPAERERRPEASVQAWVRTRARLAPELLSRAAPWVRGVFAHNWAPMQALARQFDCLPPTLWGFLLGLETGYLCLHNGGSCYRPGPATLRHQRVQNVAYVSVEDLAEENERPLHVLGHLIDHHLGCGGTEGGMWLSDGGGLEPRWREAGQRLPGLFALGYGADEVAERDVRSYFAQSLALRCRDARSLNMVDPQIDRWFRSTLWDHSFWQRSSWPEEKSVNKQFKRD